MVGKERFFHRKEQGVPSQEMSKDVDDSRASILEKSAVAEDSSKNRDQALARLEIIKLALGGSPTWHDLEIHKKVLDARLGDLRAELKMLKKQICAEGGQENALKQITKQIAATLIEREDVDVLMATTDRLTVEKPQKMAPLKVRNELRKERDALLAGGGRAELAAIDAIDRQMAGVFDTKLQSLLAA